MPKGVPVSGFRKTKKYKSQTLLELEQDIASKAPGFVEELEKYVKPFPCPHCGNEIQVIDKEVAMYMVDRALGKPKLKHEVDITEKLQLTADQVDSIIENHLDGIMAIVVARYLPVIVERYEIEIRALLAEGQTPLPSRGKDLPWVEGEVKEIPDKMD